MTHCAGCREGTQKDNLYVAESVISGTLVPKAAQSVWIPIILHEQLQLLILLPKMKVLTTPGESVSAQVEINHILLA